MSSGRRNFSRGLKRNGKKSPRTGKKGTNGPRRIR
jgi:hypothetical protein